MNLAGTLELNAREQPDEPAIYTLSGAGYTWGELDEQASRFANVLQERGLEPDDKIALYAPSVPEFVVALYGSMKAGVVAMPLNMRFEAEEIQYLLDHVEHRAVFTVSSVAGLLEELSLDHVEHVLVAGDDHPTLDGPAVHDYESVLASAPPTFETEPRLDDEPAFFMHTSGTTGRAKPVVATHGTVRAHAMGYADRIELSNDDVAMTSVPLFHNGGLNLHLTLFVYLGAPNVLLQGWDEENALTAIDEFDVTYTFLIPTMLYDLINREPAEAEEAYDVDSLRLMGVGGQNVPVSTTQTFEERFGALVLEAYGLTETMPAILSNAPDARTLSTAGRPIGNVADVRIVDPEDWTTELGPNEAGELIVSGDVVTPGYYERPDANAEDFETDEDGRRWLHTGDVARRDDDWFVTIEDRVDDMIITGGENVYPSEVEQVLYGIDAVEEAVVVGEPHDRWGERVAAAIVADEALDAEAVYEHVAESGLADYKRPREVVFLDELPRSGPEKIDRLRIVEEHFES